MSDLTALAANKQFRQAIKELKRDPAGLIDVCHDFYLYDIVWLKRVVKTWDLIGPLPISEGPWNDEAMYDRTQELHIHPYRRKPLVLSWYDSEISPPDKSPRSLWQRLVWPDATGTPWSNETEFSWLSTHVTGPNA